MHCLANTVGMGSLASVSRGISDSRHITVMHTSRAEAMRQVNCTCRSLKAVPHLFCVQPAFVELKTADFIL